MWVVKGGPGNVSPADAAQRLPQGYKQATERREEPRALNRGIRARLVCGDERLTVCARAEQSW